MQEFIAPRNAEVVDVKGAIHTDVGNRTLLNSGDNIPKGMVLILPQESTITLAYDDGSEQVISGNLSTEPDADNTTNLTADVSPISESLNDVLDDINAIQELIESGDDIELPDTAAGGVLDNAGTSFVTLDRDAEELLAQARYDTTEPANTAAIIVDNEPDALNEISDLTFPQNDQITIDEDQIAQGNVLDNDIDANDDLTVLSFTISGDSIVYLSGETAEVEGGSLTINSDGSFTFTPLANWNGELPLITYTTNTNATGNLSITVTPVSDLIDDSETISVQEDTPTSGNVLDNASSPDGPLTITSVVIGGVEVAVGATTQLDEGEFTLNEDGSYTFVPADNFNGDLPEISYTVTDAAGDTQTSTISISVTPVSDLTDDSETISVQEDTPTSGNVLDNASSPDGPLTITSVVIGGVEVAVGATTQLDEGEFTLNEDGSYTFVPADNFNGDLPEISYTVTDGAGDTQTSTLTISVTPVSDLTDDSETISVQEDTPTSGNVLDNASSPDGPLTITSVVIGGVEVAVGVTTQLDEGEFTLNEDGSYTFVPADNFNGDLPDISYTVTDGAGDTQTSTIAISVTPVSDLTDDSETISVQEDTPTSGNVLDNASSPDGPLTITSVVIGGVEVTVGATTQLDEGEFTLNEDGSYTFVPADNFNGDLPEISYTVTDAAGDTQTSTISISVTPVSDLTDDSETISVQEDTPTSGNVLDNASSPDGPLTITSVVIGGVEVAVGVTTQLDEGEFTLNEDGSYTFVPADNFNGDLPDISYTVTDAAGDTQTSTISISVTPVSDLTDDSETISVQEDTPTSGNVLDNASSPDGPLTITSVVIGGVEVAVGATTQLDEGEFTLNEDGSYTFVPADNFNGDLPEISYTVTDGAGDTQTSTLTISVTPVSDLTDDSETISVQEDTPTSGNVLDNATTADGDGPVTVVSFVIGNDTYLAGETARLAEGDFTLNADGTYTFVPADDYNGDVPVISYNIQDAAGDTQTSTLNINVTPTSDLTDANESITIDEDETASGSVLDNASTADGDGPVTIISFVIGNDTYLAGETAQLAEGDFTLNADGTYTFVPTEDYNGDVPVISYNIQDAAGDTQTSTLNIRVSPVSDLVDANESITIDEDETASGSVLDNASTADGDGPVTIISFVIGNDTYLAGETAQLAEGDFTLNADGTYTFVPTEDYNGDVPVISYNIQDAAGDTQTSTLNIRVSPVSDLVDANESITINEDETATGSVLDNASTADGDGPVTVVSFVIGNDTYLAGETAQLAEGDFTLNADGTYTFVPADDYNGDVPVISYNIQDAAGDELTSTLTIDITPTSDLTDANESITINEDETANGSVLDNATTADGPVTVISFVIGNDTYLAGETARLAEGDFTLNADGTYTFVPAADYNGDVPVISYNIQDAAGDELTSTLTIDITPTSDLTDANESITINEDETANGSVLDNATTADGPVTVISFVIGNDTYLAGETAQLAEGDFTLNADGTYTFVPADDYNGDVPVISYNIQDAAGDELTSTLTIDITPTSDLVDANESIMINEDETASGSVLDNATTADGDGPVTVVSFVIGNDTYLAGETAQLAEGDFTLNADGTYTFVPAEDYNGDVPVISYNIQDAAGDELTSTLTIDITPTSDLTDANESITIDEDETASGNVLDNASTANGPVTVISFVIGNDTYLAGETAQLAEGDFTLNADGTYTFVPSKDYNGDVPVISYNIQDAAGDTQTSTLNIRVSPTSDLVDANESITINEDETASGSVLDNATTADGPVTVVSFVIGNETYLAGETAQLAEGDFTLNADGTYTFVPAEDYNGDVPVISYNIQDAAGDELTSTLTIDITPTSDLTDANESITIDEDETASGSVLDNASTADGDGPVTVVSFVIGNETYLAGETAQLAEGDFTLNADGTYTFVPAADYNGDVPVISYNIQDAAGDELTSTLTIDITPTSDLTDANESITINEDETASGSVLDNATTADGDSPVTIISFVIGNETYLAGETAQLAEGDFTLNADGTYTFVPTEDYNGDVPVISYNIQDAAGDELTSTLTIDITPTSDLVDANESITIEEDETASGSVLDNATTADGPVTVISFVIGNDTYLAGETAQLAEGDFTLNADGTYTFVPADDYNGDVPVISYNIQDAAGDELTSTLTIDITPTSDLVDANESIMINEDETASGSVLDNATTADGDGPVTVVSFVIGNDTYLAGETAQLAEGDFTLNADGTYTFVPAEDYNGDVPVISYNIQDAAGDELTSTLTIDITPTSDLTDANESITIDEDETASGSVLDNASTADGDGPVTVVSFVIGNETYLAGETAQLAEGDFTLNADGTYTFVPAADYNGDVPVISYNIQDAAGDELTSTLTIDITPTSDLTDANESITINEDETANGSVLDNATTADGPVTVVSFVIGNETYLAGETAQLAEGDFTLNADGTYTFVPAEDYNGDVPVISYNIQDAAGDELTSTLTIDITPTSDLTDANESITIDEDETASGSVLDNASTADGDGPVTVVSFVIGNETYLAGETAQLAEGDFTLNADGTYTFVPAADYNGDVPVISYNILDAAGDELTSTLTIDITPTSDLTDANESITINEDETASGSVLDNASTADGDGPVTVVSFVIGNDTYLAGETAQLAEGDFILNADGTYTFVPADDYNGDVPVISYNIQDAAGDELTSTLTIIVTPSIDNIPPVASDDSFSVNEGETVSGNVISRDDGDGIVDNDGGDGATLFVTQVNGLDLEFGTNGYAEVEVADGILYINAQGDFNYDNSGFILGSTSPSFTYTVSDGTDTAQATVTIDVLDSAPVANDDNNYILLTQNSDADGHSTSMRVGGSIILRGSSGDVRDSSEDGTIELVSVAHNNVVYVVENGQPITIQGEYGTLTINANGRYSYRSTEGLEIPETGVTDVFTYTIKDGDEVNPETDTADLTVFLVPGLVDDDETLASFSGNVLDNGSSHDLNADNVSVELSLAITRFQIGNRRYSAGETAELDEGNFTLNSDGSYIFEPSDEYDGTVPDIVYTVEDERGDFDTSTLTITEPATVSPLSLFGDNESFDTSTIDTSLIQSSSRSSISELNFTNDNEEQPDLSDLLSDDSDNSLDEYLAFDDVEQNSTLSDDLITGEVDAVDAQTVELITIEGDDTSQHVTNGLLTDGATIVGDSAAPSAPALAEIDSSDIL